MCLVERGTHSQSTWEFGVALEGTIVELLSSLSLYVWKSLTDTLLMYNCTATYDGRQKLKSIESRQIRLFWCPHTLTLRLLG